jgi:type 1 glutamine amidotransferase
MQWSRRKFLAISGAGLTGMAWGQTHKGLESRRSIVFLAGQASHGYGEHEHPAGCRLLAAFLNDLPNVKAEVFEKQWPINESALERADAVVFYGDGGSAHMMRGHADFVSKLAKQGTGLGFIHYALIPPEKSNALMLRGIGGYYEPGWSVNPIWQATFTELPRHPIMKGVEPFTLHDEWYYHMRFKPNMKGVQPLLSALPPAETLKRPDGPHSNNPHVRKAVLEDKQSQHLAWVYERENGGRGFGFTGGHYHWNWAHDSYRTLLLNSIAWLARVNIPKNGIPSKTPGFEELMSQLGTPPGKFQTEPIKQMLHEWQRTAKTNK